MNCILEWYFNWAIFAADSEILHLLPDELPSSEPNNLVDWGASLVDFGRDLNIVKDNLEVDGMRFLWNIQNLS